MDKWRLIEITLEQLKLQWQHNKELFVSDSLDDSSKSTFSESEKEPYICWEPPKVSHKEQQALALVNKKVKLTYSKVGKYFKCEITSVGTLPGHKPDNLIIASKNFIPIRKLYRDFMSLRKEIVQYRKSRENHQYLDDLYKVFPGTLDDLILGDHNDD